MKELRNVVSLYHSNCIFISSSSFHKEGVVLETDRTSLLTTLLNPESPDLGGQLEESAFLYAFGGRFCGQVNILGSSPG